MKLIDKDLLIEAVEGAIKVLEAHDANTMSAKVPLAIIKATPTIDAEPVKRGKDVYYKVLGDHHCEFKCSVCGAEIIEFISDSEVNYCYHCGTRMEGEDE